MNKEPKNKSGGYNTLNTPLNVDTMSVNNKFNDYLQQTIQKNGLFVDFTGHLSDTAHCVSLKNFGTQSGRSPRHDVKIAQSMQHELNAVGMMLEDDFYRTHINILVSCYMISGLSYCSIKSRDKASANSFLCTKNPSAIRVMCDRYNIEFPHSAVSKYRERFVITEEEIRGNYLNTVKIKICKSGLKLTACKISPNSKSTTLVPMYVIGFYNDAVVACLSKGMFKVGFKTGSSISYVTASVNIGLLSKYTGVNPHYIADSVYSPDDIGILRLFDINRNKFVHVRLIDIINLKKLC